MTRYSSAGYPHAGDKVLIRDAFNQWHEATAVTDVEGTHDYSKPPGRRKVHDFPVIWIEGIGKDGKTFRAPWPAEDVKGVETP